MYAFSHRLNIHVAGSIAVGSAIVNSMVQRRGGSACAGAL
jgi:hypothetical protein